LHPPDQGLRLIAIHGSSEVRQSSSVLPPVCISQLPITHSAESP
jgi:hypothetical protein